MMLGILHDFVDAFELGEESVDIGEVAVGGQLEGRDAIGDRAHGLEQIPLEREKCASCTSRASWAC